MADLDGSYEITAETPLGSQKMTLTIKTEGNAFTGASAGEMGSSDISGTIAGDTLTWKQNITVPMPLTLDCEATINGDALTGTIDTGGFGKFPIKGQKVA